MMNHRNNSSRHRRTKLIRVTGRRLGLERFEQRMLLAGADAQVVSPPTQPPFVDPTPIAVYDAQFAPGAVEGGFAIISGDRAEQNFNAKPFRLQLDTSFLVRHEGDLDVFLTPDIFDSTAFRLGTDGVILPKPIPKTPKIESIFLVPASFETLPMSEVVNTIATSIADQAGQAKSETAMSETQSTIAVRPVGRIDPQLPIAAFPGEGEFVRLQPSTNDDLGSHHRKLVGNQQSLRSQSVHTDDAQPRIAGRALVADDGSVTEVLTSVLPAHSTLIFEYQVAQSRTGVPTALSTEPWESFKPSRLQQATHPATTAFPLNDEPQDTLNETLESSDVEDNQQHAAILLFQHVGALPLLVASCGVVLVHSHITELQKKRYSLRRFRRVEDASLKR